MSGVDFKHHKALIVEDNDFVRFTVKKYLVEFGFAEVFEAANGMDGLEMLSHNPDIVVCDIHMEPLNGFEFLKMVRKMKTPIRQVPILFLTSNSGMDYVQKAIALNVDAYLLKPIAPEDLRKKMGALLARALTA